MTANDVSREVGPWSCRHRHGRIAWPVTGVISMHPHFLQSNFHQYYCQFPLQLRLKLWAFNKQSLQVWTKKMASQFLISWRRMVCTLYSHHHHHRHHHRHHHQREADDLCGHRGLAAGSDHQTFAMSLPHKLRAYYDKVSFLVSSSYKCLHQWHMGQAFPTSCVHTMIR